MYFLPRDRNRDAPLEASHQRREQQGRGQSVRILFLHQNFPGQFLQVATALRQQSGHELLALVPAGHDGPRIIPVRTYPFDPRHTRTNVPLARHYTDRVARGAAVAKVLRTLQEEGFKPDLVVGHGGWGETLFVRDVWPQCQILLYAEYFYWAEQSDVDFDPALFAPPADDSCGWSCVRAMRA